MANLVRIKKRTIYLFVTLLIITFIWNLYTRSNPENYFIWEPNLGLKTSDFQKSIPVLATKFDAWLAGGFKMDQYGEIAKVSVFIDRSNSWMDNSYDTVRLLNHETYHANIYYLIAASLNRRIVVEQLSRNDAEELMNNQYYPSTKRMQNLYDYYTAHSANREQQLRWNILIDSLILSEPTIGQVNRWLKNYQ